MRLFALALLLAVPVAAQPGPGVPVDSLAQAYAEAHALPSLVVGVVADGQRHVVGVGEVGGAAPDGQTVYEIGSISKVLTSLALADAVVRGELALEAPLADVLGLPVGAHADGPIRLVDLATHTSGLPRLDLAMGFAPGFDLADPYARYGDAQLATFLANAAPATAPGAAHLYSNAGVGALGFALAHHADTTYGALVADRVLGPLGLSATTLDAARIAPAHGPDGAPVPYWTWTEATAGAGGWRSTVDDLLTLVEAALDPAATPLADALALTLEPRHRIDARSEIGLGWVWIDLPGVGPVAAHDGGTGGSVAFVAAVPEAGVGVVVLINRQADAASLAVDLVRRLAVADAK